MFFKYFLSIQLKTTFIFNRPTIVIAQGVNE